MEIIYSTTQVESPVVHEIKFLNLNRHGKLLFIHMTS
jgi:hypothetical protein